MLSSPFIEYVHPDDVESTVMEMERQKGVHDIFTIVNRYRSHDGSFRWFQWKGKATDDGREIYAVARDFTEIHGELKELREKGELYWDFYENAPVEYQVLDSEGNIQHVNHKWTESFGYSFKEVSGRWFGTLLAPGMAEEFRNQISLLKTRGKIHAEFEIITKEGINKKVILHGTMFNNPSGNNSFIHCVLHDITESSKTKDFRKEQENRLKAVLESVGDAVMVLDTSGKVVFSNSRFAGMWGIPVERLGLGEEENLMNFVVGRLKELKMIQDKAKEMSESGKTGIDYLEFSDGRIFELRVFPLMVDNHTGGSILFLRDSTEKIKNENNLKESEERFRFIAEYAPDLIFIKTNGRIIFANKQCIEITGYTQEEFCNPEFDFFGLIIHKEQEMIREKLRVLSTGQPVDPFECNLIHRNGNPIQILLSLTRINSSQVNTIIGIVTDITEFKHAEIATRQKVESLERFHNLMVGREMKMVELKKEINRLLLLLGEEERYKIVG
jgi:PAS domain S-box-containing protein